MFSQWHPIFSLSRFDTIIFETGNPFSYLSDSSDAEISFSIPAATSSPSKVSPSHNDIPLGIHVLNCQSMKTPGKPAQLQTIIESTQADIVIGSALWLNPSISSSEVFPGNYISYRNDRSDGKGGGVFLLVSSKYESQVPEELKAGEDCELGLAKVKIQGSKDLYIGSFYKLPDKQKPDYLEQLQKYLSRIPTQNGAHLWLVGDFNLVENASPNECVLPHTSHGAQCQQLLTIAKDTFLNKMVDEPTMLTGTKSSILDLF